MSKVLELNIDSEGQPYIEIAGHFASSDIKEKLLSQFINKALANGLEIIRQTEIGDYSHIKIKELKDE